LDKTSSDIKIIDNFLVQPYFDEIKNKIKSSYFPWFYDGDITKQKENKILNFNDPLHLSKIGFSHTVFVDNNVRSEQYYYLFSGFFGQLLNITSCFSIVRCRLDMTLFNPIKFMHTPHTDLDIPHTTAILYITDSDAKTIVYNEKGPYENLPETLTVKDEILPKENRLVIFDGLYIHTGFSPSQYNDRILINVNLV